MTKRINLTMVIVLLIAFNVSSCRKNEESLSDKLSGLKSVTFPEKPDEVLETKTLRDLGGGHREYSKLIKKQMTVDPVELVNELNSSVIYPGSILRGDSFMEGNLDPIAVVNPKEVTISISLQGKDFNVKRTTIPSVSNFRQQINDLKTDKKIDYVAVPSYMEYYANKVDTYGSANKTFRAYGSTNVLFGLIKSGFSYETSELSINQTKYVLIKVRQVFYNIAVDAKPYNEWGDLEQSNIGDYEPVYISSVDYGRVAHLLIKTEKSIEETKRIISGSIKACWGLAKAGIDKTDSTYQMFESNDIKVMTLGGPVGFAKKIDDLESFINFLQVPSTEEMVKSAVPIAYKVRTLKDNKTVQVRTYYTEVGEGRE